MQRASSQPPSPPFAITESGDRLAFQGALTIHTLVEAEKSLHLGWKQRKSRALDLGELDSLDTPGALLLCALRNHDVELTRIRPEHKALLDLVCGLDLKPLPKPRVI